MGKLLKTKSPLYRAFDAEEYARDFLLGRFRLTALATYKTIEDSSRRDMSEGEGHFFDQSNHEWHIEFGGKTYLLCLAGPDVDLKYLRDRFGQWVVRIDKPESLARDIEASLSAKGLGTFNGVHGRPVAYSKGQRVMVPDDPMRRLELILAQKPDSFRDESEYRLYTIVPARHEELAGEFLHIDLGTSLGYARLI